MSKRKDETEYGSAENGGRPDETPREETAAPGEGTVASEAAARAAVPPTFLVNGGQMSFDDLRQAYYTGKHNYLQ